MLTQCNECSIETKVLERRSRVWDLCPDCKTIISEMSPVTQTKLKQVYEYDPVAGTMIHRRKNRLGSRGQNAYGNHSQGYATLRAGKKTYLAHHIIWLYMTGNWPTDQLDHINHDRKDNRWNNLRQLNDGRDNQRNMSRKKNNNTGFNGVALHKPTGRYRAYIWLDCKQKHLGLFDSIEEAAAARQAAQDDSDYHPNHGK